MTDALRPRQLSCCERFLEKHRAELVVLIVLPISWWIWLFRTVRRSCNAPAPAEHDARVAAVAAAVAANDSTLMRTDRSVYESHSVRNSDKTTTSQVPLRSLRAILSLDAGTGIFHCEPGVTVGEATRWLLARGRILECTLEMADATLGGLAMAQGMTTHSHICGLLHETIEEWEVVLGDGRPVRATATNEHSDLFAALPLSHGSLGLLVGLRIRTVPSKPWVRLVYSPVRGDIAAAYQDWMCRGAFFVEGIVFDRNVAVLMEGTLVDEAKDDAGAGATNSSRAAGVVNRIGLWFKPWFYKHVETINAGYSASSSTSSTSSSSSRAQPRSYSTGRAHVEYIPTYDYLMRHDRSMCMTMGTVIPYGNHPLFRACLGWMLPPQMSFLKSSHTPETREESIYRQVYQDISMPIERLDEALSLAHDLFEIYPLLMYPCALVKRGIVGMLRTGGGCAGEGGEEATSTMTWRRTADGGLVEIMSDAEDAAEEDAGDGESTLRFQLNANLGIYGVPRAIRNAPREPCAVVSKVRALEKWVRDVGGFQHTYCDSFQGEEEFQAMFNHDAGWRAARVKYGAEGRFPTVYDKTRPEIDVWARLALEEAMLKADGG